MEAPKYIPACCNFLVDRHLHCVGLFQINPKKSSIISLKAELEGCSRSYNKVLELSSPHVIAGVVAMYLRDLDTPLIPLDNIIMPPSSESGTIHDRAYLPLTTLFADQLHFLYDYLKYQHGAPLYTSRCYICRACVSDDQTLLPALLSILMNQIFVTQTILSPHLLF
jgi:hypothetical protein